MKKTMFFLALFSLFCGGGCHASTSRIISEVIHLPPELPLIIYDFGKQEYTYNFGTDSYEHYRYLGASHKSYRYIYEGIRLIRVTLLENGPDYIFEIQTGGDIDLARRKYGKGLQFQIKIPGVDYCTPFIIFTTGGLKEAVLVKSKRLSAGDITLTLDGKDNVVSVHWDSPSNILARLQVEIDRDRMRIYLPKKLAIEIIKDRGSESGPVSGEPIYYWHVYVRLALPPLKPIESNIPDVFRMPAVYFMRYPTKGHITLEANSWRIKRISDNPKAVEEGR